jgi:hypothetical protein
VENIFLPSSALPACAEANDATAIMSTTEILRHNLMLLIMSLTPAVRFCFQI